MSRDLITLIHIIQNTIESKYSVLAFGCHILLITDIIYKVQDDRKWQFLNYEAAGLMRH